LYISSDGTIYDFVGNETIGKYELAFGETHKYIYLNPNNKEMSDWDNGIMLSNCKFEKEEHNIFS
jgi:hypothetical protein